MRFELDQYNRNAPDEELIADFKCKACGRTPATDPSVTLDVDHIKAWSKGGSAILENLQTLCTKCNIGKSNLEFLNSSPTEGLNVNV